MSQISDANLSTLIVSIAHSAKIGLGFVEHPDTKALAKNLEMAQYNIDLLMILKEKTKSNLDESEEKLLGSIINDLQMDFIKVQNN